MRIVLQRVKKASVKVNNIVVGEIDKGILLLVGAQKGDTVKQAEYLADRCAGLRIFEDNQGKMNLSILDVGGKVLVVSQFTLCGDISRGRRPSFDNAMPPAEAEALVTKFCEFLKGKGLEVQTGRFGAKMMVELLNDGPVTFVLEN
ncbi:MAG: D-tyrosyl-tRNA(Tyr) deacylase [candidate division Zixibacteria bacterium]|nr:D-tyrosyl-tRNA(Tyr) deacylase [candidate division Zixibacteria bacterium]